MATKQSEENELPFPPANDETTIYEFINKYENFANSIIYICTASLTTYSHLQCTYFLMHSFFQFND